MKKQSLFIGILVIALAFVSVLSTGAEAAIRLTSPATITGGTTPTTTTPVAPAGTAGGVRPVPSNRVYGWTGPAPATPVPAPVTPPVQTPAPAQSGNVIRLSPSQPATQPAPVTPPTTTAPAVPSAPVAGLTAQEQYLFDLVNLARTSEGKPPLQVDLRLVELARLKAKDLVTNNYFSHTSPTYGTPFKMMLDRGITFRYAGENIAESGSVGGAHGQLMTSPGHRAHIMEPKYTHIGIGVVPAKPAGVMVVEMFIGI